MDVPVVVPVLPPRSPINFSNAALSVESVLEDSPDEPVALSN